MITNASQWVLAQSKIKFDNEFKVEGITFELMSLNKDDCESIRNSSIHSSEAIIIAAYGGFSVNQERAIDDTNISSWLTKFWNKEQVLAVTEPATMMYQVGERVCELSGLTAVLDEMLANEKAEAEAEELTSLMEAEEEKEKDHELALVDYDLKESACNGDTPTPAIDLGQLQSDAETYHSQG